MNTATISPQARIATLVGVLLVGVAGSAFVLLHGNTKTPAATTPPAHHPTPSPVVHVVPPTVDPLLPTPLRQALEQYPIVVVGFYNSNAPVTQRTIVQARAAAGVTNAGFVPVNVLNDKVAGPLTALLPAGQLLPNPGIAIYGRPGKLLYRSDSYLSEAEVIQAVKESR